MAVVKYLGTSREKLKEFKAYRDRLIDVGMTYRPSGEEYRAVYQATMALDVMLERLTGEAEFLIQPITRSNWRPGDPERPR